MGNIWCPTPLWFIPLASTPPNPSLVSPHLFIVSLKWTFINHLCVTHIMLSPLKIFTFYILIKCMLSCLVMSHSLWTVAHQGLLCMEFSRQEYWSGLLFPTPGDLPDPGNKPHVSCVSCVGRQILYHCTAWEALYPYKPSPILTVRYTEEN